MLILFTSALKESFFEKRKEEYINSYEQLKKICNHKIQILECLDNGDSKTFLDGLSDNVLYTKKNYRFRNKGVNEILNIKYFLELMRIDDEEKIVKITGRYFLNTPSFIEECEKNNSDVFIVKDKYDQVFFGCVCMKKKVLLKFINDTNWDLVERNFENIERVFSNFLSRENFSITLLNKVDITCNINDSNLVFF
jgi:hypothetical protein